MANPGREINVYQNGKYGFLPDIIQYNGNHEK